MEIFRLQHNTHWEVDIIEWNFSSLYAVSTIWAFFAKGTQIKSRKSKSIAIRDLFVLFECRYLGILDSGCFYCCISGRQFVFQGETRRWSSSRRWWHGSFSFISSLFEIIYPINEPIISYYYWTIYWLDLHLILLSTLLSALFLDKHKFLGIKWGPYNFEDIQFSDPI